MKDTFDLDKIGKRMPYRTPDDFFDKMEENVWNRLMEQKCFSQDTLVSKNPARSYKLVIRSLVSVAAVAVIALVIGSITKKNALPSVVGTADVIQAFSQLDDADQRELLSTYQSDVFLNGH